MTTPRDAIGLSERLRVMGAAMPTCDEAATALDALQAMVEELEAEIPRLLTEQRRKLCAEHDKDITELNRVRRVSKEAIEAAESRAEQAEARVKELEVNRDHFERLYRRTDTECAAAEARATSAEQERDEALERAAKHFEESEHLVWSNDEAADAIRRLAAGTEKEGK